MTGTAASADQPIVLLDAMILGGALRRSMLLGLAEAGLLQPRWSARILDETGRAILRMTKGEIDGSRQRERIETAFPDALVTGHEVHENGLTLPDPGDIHVLAAAIEARAGIIVTENLKDFPQETLQSYGIKALSADDFIADTIKRDPFEAIPALRRMRQRFTNPTMNAADLIRKVEAQRLVQVAACMSKHKTLL